MALRKTSDGGFAARREDRESGSWKVSYESGGVDSLPRAAEAIEALEKGEKWVAGQSAEIGGAAYVFRGVDADTE